MLRICSAEIIEPVLATVKRIQRVSSFVKEDKRTVIFPFSGVNLNALESRLKNIFSNLSLSTQLYTDWMVIHIRHIIKREMNVFLPGRCKE